MRFCFCLSVSKLISKHEFLLLSFAHNKEASANRACFFQLTGDLTNLLLFGNSRSLAGPVVLHSDVIPSLIFLIVTG